MSISDGMMIESIFWTALCVHFLRTCIFQLGAWLERRKNIPQHTTPLDTPQTLPLVSVIIPARNEQENIESCIRSVMANDYLHFEVIVVNDRSSDNTGEILKRLRQEFPRLIIHNTVENTESKTYKNSINLQGKTRALHQGIERSSGDLLMMTDADCIVQQTWISTIAAVFQNPNIGLVPSFTVIRAQTIFARMQALEWVFNHTMASAGIGLKQVLGCFGNNLTIRLRTYKDVGGYPNIPFSITEDLALLQAVHDTEWQVRYICDNRTKVETLPCPTISAFIKQHKRWALGGRALGWRAVVFMLSSATLWMGIVAALWNARYDEVIGLVLARVAMDFSVMLPSLLLLRAIRLAAWFPLGIVFFLIVELITPFYLLKPSVEWKGQIFR